MIKNFKCERTEKLFNDERVAAFSAIERVARRKLEMLDASVSLADLRTPPANRLELLRGDRAGQHSLRINRKYRLCFRWKAGNAYDVEIVDYHRG